MGKREQILEALWRSEAPVSGERLAAALGVSRAAVWKEISYSCKSKSAKYL